MSFYWKDPDGNNVERLSSCFPDAQAAMDYMNSPEFVRNPVGQPLDGEALLVRMRAGATDEELMYYDSSVEVDVTGPGRADHAITWLRRCGTPMDPIKEPRWTPSIGC